ncbi:3-beta-hydroxysteroid dehydrogenase [Trichodelitschia bisporula]|uniref:3-beta-hydroxysteroid dehydrogenase n=1 Tax=Trichodelitschia bisporula TaxID=703511 RepID=A0A6G1I8W6_9PEZI|nr:3-beta-hydroxysteroid dehydrogenase [Trichodelitschia bisporula]
MAKKVALITGGASGMGLAVAEALSARGGWDLHLLDLNTERGEAAAKSVSGSFHKTDVNNYASLSSTFDKIHKTAGRLDFVFANAGIVERWNFYGKQEQTPPPEPDMLSIDIDLKSVVTTTYLAQHYFRLSPNAGSGEQNLVMTASCGGFYPSPFSPMYSAAKHGVVGLTRSVAKHFYLADRIRVNAICPGTVRTNLLDSTGWDQWPEEYFTPVETIVKAVLTLVDGGDMVDAKGVKVEAGKDWGRCVEVNGKNLYFREQIEYCDENMAQVMRITDISERKSEDLKFYK